MTGEAILTVEQITESKEDQEFRLLRNNRQFARDYANNLIMSKEITGLCPTQVWVNNYDFKNIKFTDKIVQAFIGSRTKKVMLEIWGKGGFNKEEVSEVSTGRFPLSYDDFKEFIYSESSLIYAESLNSYDSLKGRSFLSWYWYKLSDLMVRFWRQAHILGMNKNSLQDYTDIGRQNNIDNSMMIFRESLSTYGRNLLLELETGIGFKLKKSDVNKNVSCHMGKRNFWDTFIKDRFITFQEFSNAWEEIREEFQNLELNNTTFTIGKTA